MWIPRRVTLFVGLHHDAEVAIGALGHRLTEAVKGLFCTVEIENPLDEIDRIGDLIPPDEIVAERRGSGDVEGVGQFGGDVDRKNRSVDDNLAGIGDADLWTGRFDTRFGDPISVISFCDIDLDTCPELISRFDYKFFPVIEVTVDEKAREIFAGTKWSDFVEEVFASVLEGAVGFELGGFVGL